jgi:signal transduction histidine kinase
VSQPGASPLRVGIFGDTADAREWSAVLANRSVEVLRAPDLETLLAESPSLILIFTTPAEAAVLGRTLAERPGSPPVTMFVDDGAGGHPHTELVQALVQGKTEWESTFDAIVDPVTLLDAKGTIVRANLGLARTLNRPIRELIGTPYHELIGRPVDGAHDPIAQSLADREARTEDVHFEKLPGVVQVTTSSLENSQELPAGLVVILKDVTELREQQERLLQASRLADIGQLAAGVAHEINTPVASIALRAESLLKNAEDPRLMAIDSFKNFPRYLKTMDAEIFRCKKIISALLEFSRSRKPEVRETDINLLAEKATDLVGHQMRLKQVGLDLALAPGLRHIQADDGQIRQVLIALLMNALDATSPGGHVRVETAPEGDTAVRLTVGDDGTGIPREYLDKIFSPFFTTKPVGQGTGLGLAICHGIITAHGGEIQVESETGKGTRMMLVLPIGSRPATPAGRPQPV